MEDPDFDEYMLELESSLKEKEYTRLPTSNPDVEYLHALAQDLFERIDKLGVEDSRTEAEGQILNDIAAIISKSYAEKGDYSQLADDEALMMIRDVLIHYNPAIIKRNEKRRLPKC
jgi:hypothetical protein